MPGFIGDSHVGRRPYHRHISGSLRLAGDRRPIASTGVHRITHLELRSDEI